MFLFAGSIIMTAGSDLRLRNKNMEMLCRVAGRLFYNIGNIECVAFPIFQKNLQYESEREARMAHRR